MGFKSAARLEKKCSHKSGYDSNFGVVVPAPVEAHHTDPAIGFETPFIDHYDKPSPEIPLAY